MVDKFLGLLNRVFFCLSLLLLSVSLLDLLLKTCGWSLYWLPSTGDQLIQLATILIIFVIAILLRQIRDILKK